jgi:zinc protease
MIPQRQRLGRLDVLFEEDRTVPLVYLYIDFLCGTESDPEGKSGRSRLAAHMLRMGTVRRTRENLNRAIESLGADLDVSAGHHHIAVSGHMIVESFEPFAGLLREVLYEPGMRKEDFEKLRRESVADIVEGRQDDQGIAYRHFRALLFGGHPYGRRNIGTRAELERLTFEEVAGLHESMLRRTRMTLGCAGDLGRGAFEEKVASFVEPFSTMEAGPPDVPAPPKPAGLRIRLVDKPDRVQSQIYMGHLAPGARDADYFPIVLLNTAFGGTFTARLSQEIRRKRGMSYGAYSRILRARTRDAFYLWTFPSAKDTASCLRIQLEMLRELKEKGVTDEEFDFAVRYLINHFLFAVETAPMRVLLAMKELSQDLPPRFFETYRDRVGAVTKEQVDAAARSFIDPDNLCAGVLCTAGPLRADIEKELKDFSPAIEVVPYDKD